MRFLGKLRTWFAQEIDLFAILLRPSGTLIWMSSLNMLTEPPPLLMVTDNAGVDLLVFFELANPFLLSQEKLFVF